jgi:hypothetical protein
VRGGGGAGPGSATIRGGVVIGSSPPPPKGWGMAQGSGDRGGGGVSNVIGLSKKKNLIVKNQMKVCSLSQETTVI